VRGRFLCVALIASFLAANVAGAATTGQGQHHPKKGTHSGQHHGAKKHSQHSGAHKKNNKPHTGQ
jgi:Ni/Co efflux regulator RcnB